MLCSYSSHWKTGFIRTAFTYHRLSIFGEEIEDPDELDEKSDVSSEKEEEEEELKKTSSNQKLSIKRSVSVPSWKIRQKVDKIYTVGCFDLFHEGHIILMERLKELGSQVYSYMTY
jgi:bifunctional ADP-heptose synthase (sugar kinase/adenylyltransferase)